MINYILLFSFPAVHAKKVTIAFDGSHRISSRGVTLLAMAERRPGLAHNLAQVFPDRVDPTRVVRSLVDMFRARISRSAVARGRRPRSSAVRSGVQARLRSPAGHGPGFVFPTDAVAAGELAARARRDPHDRNRYQRPTSGLGYERYWRPFSDIGRQFGRNLHA